MRLCSDQPKYARTLKDTMDSDLKTLVWGEMVVISLFPSLLRLSSPSFSLFFPLPYFFSDPSSTSFAYPPSFHDFSVPFIFIAPRVPSLLWCLIFLPFPPPLASPPSFLPSFPNLLCSHSSVSVWGPNKLRGSFSQHGTWKLCIFIREVSWNFQDRLIKRSVHLEQTSTPTSRALFSFFCHCFCKGVQHHECLRGETVRNLHNFLYVLVYLSLVGRMTCHLSDFASSTTQP